MRTFINLPGSTRADFNSAPLDDLKEYASLQHYIQALLRHCPHDIEKLVTCPAGESEDQWIYAMFRQYLQELNFYAYEHRDVSTSATEPAMEFYLNGQKISCMSAAHQPPKAVPAIDYITQTIDQATGFLLDSKNFPDGRISEQGRPTLETFMRRLYRVFLYSHLTHRDIFERIERETHICERFTKFGRLYSLLKPEDIHIPESYWESRPE
jgi:hypothetical protein